MKKENTCFFTGHRIIPNEEYDVIFRKTEEEIEMLCKSGIEDFIAGGAIGYDTLAAKAVLSLRGKYNIKLHIYIPCKEQDKYFTDEQKKEYVEILSKADSTHLISEHYHRGCMHIRNKKMVDDSSFCITYCKRLAGGTAYTVSYAEKNNINIIYI